MDAIYGDVYYRKRRMEQKSPVPSRQFAFRPRYQAFMKTPDDASEEDVQEPELMPRTQGMGIQPHSPRYGDIDHRGERRSRRDW